MGTYPNYGGVEKVSTVLANQLVKSGHNVFIASFQQPHLELAEKELNKDVKLFTLEYPIVGPKSIKGLHKIIKKEKVNIIINQWGLPVYVAFLCWMAIRHTDCKIITVLHNIPTTNARIQSVELELNKPNKNLFFNKLKLNLITFISRLSLRGSYFFSNEFVVLSPSFIKQASQFMFLKRNKILSIANPLTIETAEGFIEKKEKEVIYVGRIEYNQKRNYRLLDIWELLENKYPDWTLKIIGDGPDRNNLQQLIFQKNLKRVKIEGFKNPIEYYKRASILLLTSEYEGFGLVVTEGMNYSVLPVVYGSYSAIYDIVNNSEDGFIVEKPYSCDKFAEILSNLMENEDELNKKRYNAFCKSKRFTMDSIEKQWYHLFKNM